MWDVKLMGDHQRRSVMTSRAVQLRVCSQIAVLRILLLTSRQFLNHENFYTTCLCYITTIAQHEASATGIFNISSSSSSCCFAESVTVYFANTLALTPFPLRIGPIYGSGLFWCKGDDILRTGQLLTTTFCLLGVNVGVHMKAYISLTLLLSS